MHVATSHEQTHTGLFIAGESREADEEFPVFDPADPETVIGHAAAASADQAREAVRAAHEAFPAWAELDPQRRAELVGASLESLAYRAEQFVAGRVAEPVVDLLEVVEVDEDQHEVSALHRLVEAPGEK